ncbi:Uncharacterized protein FKW44_004461 [Caligus rogercresseyi]|uniref:Uncharacterized protein n=1 Tax=Caligus rogercresseyi TaxID=217165 RepID=A0A7T8HLM0_CALRO|nr:Uncharacterized protein FKW44_004461 [Caligus rogercresseyi]
MGFSCKLKRVSIQALSLGRGHSRLEDHYRVPEDDRETLHQSQRRIHLKDCLLMWDNARPHAAA